ncbi:TetR/AcrR family transcriptional regulator [Microbacterium karelineae]|uniref:TetR/AcrR family transcriptional regulator n=1 Tax=Microbacterium karelineae TaxID=2654283 RepID=UPI0012EA05F5|nr:TetR/AcrR family transcriptional regulator [Microbacterium karelineae]
MPKIVDHDERRELIVDATWRLIQRGGFDRATMREIAEEAGFAHGALARYFPDKQSLISAAFVRAYSATNARLDEALAGVTGLAGLRELCRQILPFGASSRPYARVVVAFWEQAMQNDDLSQLHRSNNMRWRGLMWTFLEQARSEGELDDGVEIGAVVDEVAAMNAGWQVMSLLMPETAIDERITAALDQFLDRIRA